MSKRKVSPMVKVKKENNEIRLLVTNSKAFKEWVKVHLPDVPITENSENVFSGSAITEHHIKQLIESPWVKYIDKGKRSAKEERALGNFDLTLNNVTSTQTLYPTSNGSDIVISIKEKPFDQTDLDFQNRIVLNDQFDEPATIHASIMATIAAGAGNSEPSGKGIATHAGLTTSDFNELLPDNGTLLTSLGVTVQNHSYGVGLENYYGIESREYDKHCREFPSIVHVFSSGNEGDKADNTGVYANITGFANLTGQFKTSKNTISVGSADKAGNVILKSSRGPTQDGRVKPELIAYGDAGSSEAAAVVSGIVALVQQTYQNQNGSLPESALVKAVLLNSANDAGRPEVDFETGYGNADALGAVRTIEQNKFISGSIVQSEQKIHSINVPAGAYRLKVTIAWNDPEGVINSPQALINDLDLVVSHPSSGISWLPWVLDHEPASLTLPAARKEDHLNVVEQVTITNLESGVYDIVVKGTTITLGPQVYYIAYEFESGFEWTYPLDGNSMSATQNTFLRWQWNNPSTTGTLEFKYENEVDWTELSTAVDLSAQYFPWVTPDTTARVQLRLVTSDATYTTNLFFITQPLPLKVGYNCEDEVLLIWNKVPAADQYQLFRLGEKHLEPFLTTADTFAILNSSEKEVLYYAIAPVSQTMVGEKSTTTNYATQLTGCYLISFLPRQYVFTDDVTFDLKIGTTYKLGTAMMERYSNAGWQIIQAINPVTGVDMIFLDENPVAGINQYRVRLTDSNNTTILISNPEEVFYVRNNDLIVYPNPASQGESITLIINDENVVTIRLYDMMGRPALETSDLGYIKSFNTQGLTKGNYILEIVKSGGQRLTKRITIF